MNEETMMTYEEVENTGVNEVYEETETSGNGNLGKIVLGVGAVVAAAVAVAHFTKNKRREYQIKKLEKAGYVIYKPEDDTDEVENDFVENEEA